MTRKLSYGTALAIACLLASPAQASTIYCVSNAAALRDALLASEAVNDDVEIRARAGVYLVGNAPFEYWTRGSYALSLTGGWSGSGGQCQTRSMRPQDTVLDGGGVTNVLLVRNRTTTTTANVHVANLTLSGGSAANTLAGCLGITATEGTPTILVERLIVTGCEHSGGSGAGGGVRIQNLSGANITLRNSLIVGNVADYGGGVEVSSNKPQSVTRLINNTIADNVAITPSATAGFRRSYTGVGAGLVELRNNAIVGNIDANGMPRDIEFQVGQAIDNQLVHNAIGQMSGANHTQTGTIIPADAGFVSSGANYRLRANSPLRNAGAQLAANDLAARDLDGMVRLQEGIVDIGAYEFEVLFRSSFE